VCSWRLKSKYYENSHGFILPQKIKRTPRRQYTITQSETNILLSRRKQWVEVFTESLLRNQDFWVVVLCGWVIPNRRFGETPSKFREAITQQHGAKIQNTCFLSKKTGLQIIKSITLLSNRYCGKLPAWPATYLWMLWSLSPPPPSLSLSLGCYTGDQTSGYSTCRVSRRTGTEFK
jgi:hypothetical protein